MIKKISTTTAALAVLTAAAPVAADSMRCGQSLVKPGDHITEVVENCGEPDRTSNIVNNEGVRIGQRATYPGGNRRDTRVVIYRGGQVARIEILR